MITSEHRKTIEQSRSIQGAESVRFNTVAKIDMNKKDIKRELDYSE